MASYDLIVIGGGPAGSAAARVASARCLGTLLIDAQSFPRNKPCGGALTEQAMSYLEFPVPDELREADVYGARVHFGDRWVEASLDHRIATIVSRDRFDHFLVERAESGGAEVRAGERVERIEESDGTVRIHTVSNSYQARHVIVAAGAASKLSGIVREASSKSDYAVGVEIDIPSAQGRVEDFSRGFVDIHFGAVAMGYGWVFPHECRFNIGVAGIAKDFTQGRRLLSKFIEELPAEIRDRKSEGFNRAGHPIPAGGVRRRLARSRVLLAGDSAGFVDSFYGEGIAYAIRSGQLAAQAVATSRNPGSTYAKWCNQEIQPWLRWSLRFARLVHRYPGLLLRLFATHPRVLERFLGVPARQTTYAEFLRWFLPRVPFYLATLRK